MKRAGLLGEEPSKGLLVISFSCYSSDWFLRYKDRKRVHFRIF